MGMTWNTLEKTGANDAVKFGVAGTDGRLPRYVIRAEPRPLRYSMTSDAKAVILGRESSRLRPKLTIINGSPASEVAEGELRS
jgi:hypothetical protein